MTDRTSQIAPGGARWAYLRHQAATSFWFTPALLLVGAIALSALTLVLDRGPLGEWVRQGSWIYRIGPEGARLMLSTIAGSMITVTSLVFSLTLVSLTLASQQLGPRVITHFMQDRITQSVLGIFLATFVYALLILRTINDEDGVTFVPYCSIIVVALLAIFCFALLIYFIHHVALLIQADSVLAEIARGLARTIDQMFPEPDSGAHAEEAPAPLDRDFQDAARPIRAAASGYVQVIAQDQILEVAEAHDLTIALACQAGHFVTAPLPIAWAAPREHIDEDTVRAICAAIVLGPKRTPAQDVEFALRAIVDVVVRALSPSVNDYHTAMAGMDRIGEAVARIIRRDMPKHVLRGRDGAGRVVLYPMDFAHVVDVAFQQVCEASRNMQTVGEHLIAVLTTLARIARTDAQRAAIRERGDTVARHLRELVADPRDRERVEARIDDLAEALNVSA